MSTYPLCLEWKQPSVKSRRRRRSPWDMGPVLGCRPGCPGPQRIAGLGLYRATRSTLKIQVPLLSRFLHDWLSYPLENFSCLVPHQFWKPRLLTHSPFVIGFHAMVCNCQHQRQRSVIVDHRPRWLLVHFLNYCFSWLGTLGSMYCEFC